MIILTRLGGQPMAVNPDVIERAESTPDTVLTMLDGHKLVVAEPLDEVVQRVLDWRASVAARAFATAAAAVPAPRRGEERTGVPDPEPQLARVLSMPPRGE